MQNLNSKEQMQNIENTYEYIKIAGARTHKKFVGA
jgi:hypothetical protein